MDDQFVDHYETLQLSPNADRETIERVFRILAKRLHPDNEETGSNGKFLQLVQAHKVLSDPEKRAAYDVQYDKARALKWKVFDQAEASDGLEADKRIRQGTLSILYTARRRDAGKPGVGIYELEKLLDCPEKHMEFHIWYLKEKGWVMRTETGEFAITASGVDAAMENDLLLRKDRLLPKSTDETSRNEEMAKPAITAGDSE